MKVEMHFIRGLTTLVDCRPAFARYSSFILPPSSLVYLLSPPFLPMLAMCWRSWETFSPPFFPICAM